MSQKEKYDDDEYSTWKNMIRKNGYHVNTLSGFITYETASAAKVVESSVSPSMKYAFFVVWMLGRVVNAEFDVRFGAFEHRIAGDDVKLQGLNGKLRLSNGLEMSFGDMIAMGDFYGIYGSSISLGVSEESQIDRFLDVFRTLDENNQSFRETKKILETLEEDRLSVAEGIRAGNCPHEVYDAAGKERVKRWNCITGGGCSRLWYLSPGRFMMLAKDNFDHFGDNAVKAYRAGHQAALYEAAKGNLERAYAMDGFALHYLTDRFASGHIRVPRLELSRGVTPRTAGDMISGFMHNEDGEHGLRVHNKRGDRWIAFGDGRYLESENARNRAIMKEALERSVGEIYAAFEKRDASGKFSAIELVPWADSTGNIAPMFVYDSSRNLVLKRSNLKDVNDVNLTSYWWGWSTLAELKLVKGLPSDHYD